MRQAAVFSGGCALFVLAAAVCSECGVDAETELLAYCQKVKDVFEKNEQSKVKDIDKYLV